MRHRRQTMLLTRVFVVLLFLAPAVLLSQANGPLDLGSILRERDPETMIGSLSGDMKEKVKVQWNQLVMADSQTVVVRNQGPLYANPSLQAYVNRLGQSLIPKEASENIYLTFRIIEDPLPYADTLATGTIYLSTGMISLLDNESQLAFLLMHEAGHVVLAHNLYQIIEQEKAERRAAKVRMIGAFAGALVGGVVGGKKDVAQGAAIGLLGAEINVAAQKHRFVREIQLESDQFATQVLLEHGFDAREAPIFMAKVGNVIRRSGAAAELAFGNASDLPPRSDKMKELLGGPYQPLVARILSGKGFRMSSPRYNQLLSELKRDNGLLALKQDLFVIARTNLEEAAAVRTDDPLTMYGLGMLYRMVGRSAEDSSRATGYLRSAMEFDEVRHRFPEAYLQYAVELLSYEDPQRYPEIQKALKTYVTLYQRNSGGELPREMPFVYDYLDLAGDRNWIAYKVSNVRSEATNQLTGDAKIDGSPQVPDKRPARKQQ